MISKSYRIANYLSVSHLPSFYAKTYLFIFIQIFLLIRDCKTFKFLIIVQHKQQKDL